MTLHSDLIEVERQALPGVVLGMSRRSPKQAPYSSLDVGRTVEELTRLRSFYYEMWVGRSNLALRTAPLGFPCQFKSTKEENKNLTKLLADLDALIAQTRALDDSR